MRALLPLALLTGCAAAPHPVVGAPSAICAADRVDGLIGQPASTDLASAILSRTGARTLRWVQPGMAVTMDFRPDRVTVSLDADNRVTRITCG